MQELSQAAGFSDANARFCCVSEQERDHGRERIYEAELSFHCDCDQSINLTFVVREYPESILDFHGYRSAEAEIIMTPKVREHRVIVDL